ncbi:hypothetical protein RND81_04G087400 [Saponaria officinalis]|uniref:S-protein homolog n=1 Tax=Saponaria officinalis TaxID=3572 RepID=A0AAW1LJF0_SAPOF
MSKQTLLIIIIIICVQLIKSGSTTLDLEAAVFSARHWLSIENALSNDIGTLDIHCYKSGKKIMSDNLGLQNVLNKQYYNITFKSAFSKTVTIVCDFNYPTLGRLTGQFFAFDQRKYFTDRKCGGRHCSWKFDDDGLHLFHNQERVYNKISYWTVDKRDI